jgi:hypothetical protein
MPLPRRRDLSKRGEVNVDGVRMTWRIAIPREWEYPALVSGGDGMRRGRV